VRPAGEQSHIDRFEGSDEPPDPLRAVLEIVLTQPLLDLEVGVGIEMRRALL